MARHLGYARLDSAVHAGGWQDEARKLLGDLISRLTLSGVKVGSQQRVMPDGTVLTAHYDGTIPTVVAVSGGVAARERPKTNAAAWVPRGFVLYPVSDASKAGWGLPVQLTGNADTLTDLQMLKENMRPGLDPARWTPGGVAGQVLLTQVPGAGYPDLLKGPTGAPFANAPVVYKPGTMVYPSNARAQARLIATTEYPQWKAYRIEFTDYTSFAITAGPSAAQRNWKRTLARLVNALRGDTPERTLHPPTRGLFDPAQAASDAFDKTNVYAHFYGGFPATYQGTPDRGLHEFATHGLLGVPAGLTPQQAANSRNADIAYAENADGAPASAVENVGTDPEGWPITKISPNGVRSPQTQYQRWHDEPAHLAILIDTTFDNTSDNLTYRYDSGRFGSQYFGMSRVGYAQNISTRDVWLGVGNAWFESQYADVPIISWMSYNTRNLSSETLLASTVVTSVSEPSVEFRVYASAYYATGGEGDLTVGRTFEVSQSAAPVAGYGARSEAALNSWLYSRGRVIGIAPNAELILSAGVQRRESGDQVSYRIILITANPYDVAVDAVDARVARGSTPAARVWYVDLPDDAALHCAPQSILRGVYGEEDLAQSGDWPWIEKNSPYSWRFAGDVYVLSSDDATADMLRYACLWRFSPDGKKAACLRDGGTADEIEDIALRVPPFRFGDFGTAGFVAVDAPHVKSTGWVGGMPPYPRSHYVELTFGEAGDGSLTFERFVSAPSRGCEAHRLTPTFDTTMGAGDGGTIPIGWVRPCAVDYTADGDLAFAYHVAAWYGASHVVPGDTTSLYFPNVRQGVYFGAWNAAWPEVAEHSVWYSAIAQMGSEDMFALPAQIIDVRDRVFTATGQACPLIDGGENPDTTGYAPDYPAFVPYGSDGLYRLGTFSTECLACSSIPDEFIVRMWRGSERIVNATVANPDRFQDDLRLTGFAVQSGGGVWETFSASYANPYLKSSYARYASKRDTAASTDWIASTMFLPLEATRVWGIDPITPGTTTNQYDNTHCMNDCGPRPGYGNRPHDGFYGLDLGGWMASSFGDAAALATIMQIPGANPHTAYVRVV